nr:DUF3265 domain-containing protein [Vibrio furnissii]
MSYGGESGLRKLGMCGIHPLTRRYNSFSCSEVYIGYCDNHSGFRLN